MANEDLLKLAIDAVVTAPAASVHRIAALDALRVLADSTLHVEVSKAREENVTWSAIGQSLGVTRQAAFQRFGTGNKEQERKGEIMSKTLLLEVPEHAKKIVRAVASSETGDAISTYFGAEAIAVLTPEKLDTVWAGLLASFGKWEGFGEGSALVLGEYVVDETRLEFEAGAVTFRTSWSADGKIAGLFFLPVAG
ncbi:hypothetical protein M2390_002512 [Mycetocola sp. BIGb0189]|uniref:DUF3887 domain-containing protein n=1 Tax=Mycetocola sp. BIGb0189 TaxID=2940604 RepID=UPI0021690001|nr:DUF3887 domain-containing protein [Mycetocola sp. BIGb0189]MCS4277308.1 hypothetical protein [Mycetocola sp. BIGb0189]